MKQGRPKKYRNCVTISLSLDEIVLETIDKTRNSFSRGDFLNILMLKESHKTKEIINLRIENDKLVNEIEKSKKIDNSKISSFQKTIHSHFFGYYKEYLEKMDIHKKKFWSKQLNCKIQDLINYI